MTVNVSAMQFQLFSSVFGYIADGRDQQKSAMHTPPFIGVCACMADSVVSGSALQHSIGASE